MIKYVVNNMYKVNTFTLHVSKVGEISGKKFLSEKLSNLRLFSSYFWKIRSFSTFL